MCFIAQKHAFYEQKNIKNGAFCQENRQKDCFFMAEEAIKGL